MDLAHHPPLLSLSLTFTYHTQLSFLDMLISAQPLAVPAKEVLAATVVHNNLTTPSLPFPSTPEEVAERVTRVVADYLLTTGEHDQFEEKGRAYLQSRIAWHIDANIPIEL